MSACRQWAADMRLPVAEISRVEQFASESGPQIDVANTATPAELRYHRKLSGAVASGRVIVADDKNSRLAWSVGNVLFKAIIFQQLFWTSSPWTVSEVTPEEVDEIGKWFAVHSLPGFLKKGPALVKACKPILFVLWKGKCFVETGGRCCDDIMHSCVRKVISCASLPYKNGWRAVGRSITALLESVGGSLEVFSLQD